MRTSRRWRFQCCATDSAELPCGIGADRFGRGIDAADRASAAAKRELIVAGYRLKGKSKYGDSGLVRMTRGRRCCRGFLIPRCCMAYRAWISWRRQWSTVSSSGLHRSPDFGFSLEFAEYRAYAPGDDLRHVDWNLFARTERCYLKRYRGETNTQAHAAAGREQLDEVRVAGGH